MSVPTATKYAVLARCLRDDVACCELCGVPLGELGVDSALHHRRFRDGAIDQDTPQNLLAVCGPDNFTSGCHREIHQDKGSVQTFGWAISRHWFEGKLIDPLTVAVLIDRGSRWVYLGADGQYHDNPETP